MSSLHAAGPLAVLFVRHGETAYNRQHVRCGGDVDIPLTETGEAQARAAAAQLRGLPDSIDAIIASPLQRTRRTAEIIQQELGFGPLVFHDGLIERRMGEWNGKSIADTQPLLDAGEPPPGGECEAAFRQRVRGTLLDILGRGGRLPLLVASKGVGRVLGILTGSGPSGPAGNAEVIRFTIPAALVSDRLPPPWGRDR